MKKYTCHIEIVIEAADHNKAEAILLNIYDWLHAQSNVQVPAMEDTDE